jgi:hypothetical protein
MIKLLLGVLLLGGFMQNSGTMVRVEQITDSEQKQLSAAREEVERAQAHLLQVQDIIAGQHKMGRSSWMEYSDWYEFDGKFIVQRHESNQSNRILTGVAH